MIMDSFPFLPHESEDVNTKERRWKGAKGKGPSNFLNKKPLSIIGERKTLPSSFKNKKGRKAKGAKFGEKNSP